MFKSFLSRRLKVRVAFCVLGGVGVLNSAFAIQVTFTKIADTSTTAPEGSLFSGFDSAPAISGSNVVFEAGATTADGIFTATTSGTAITKIADTTDSLPGHSPFAIMGSFPVISGNNVSFFGAYNFSTPAGAICTGTVGQTGFTKLVDTSDSVLTNGNSFFTPQISLQSISGNNVAVSVDTTNSFGVYNGTVGVPGVSKFVGKGNVSADNVTFIDADAGGVSGNNVVFHGNYSGGSGVFTGTLGSTVFSKVISTADTAPGHTAFTRFDATSISGNNVAVVGEWSSGSGIYAGIAGTAGVTKIVDTTDFGNKYSSFSSVIASGNEIAFQADSGGIDNIIVESGGNFFTIITDNTPLFGHNFSDSITLGGFDAATNTIAFSYRQGGVTGIASATFVLPEPATLCIFSLIPVMAMRRLRK
ncbi:MAG TPA: hypothetical protein VHS31_15335 [Tepidisphaeraceae bacterium]|jgi:hypothetical protein|nr:hypothetical protein [Tepidisphaeraceae bacterium]